MSSLNPIFYHFYYALRFTRLIWWALSLLTSHQFTQLLSVLAWKNGKKSLSLIFKRPGLKEFAMLIMSHDNFMLRIFICFSIQSSWAFRWKQINKNNPQLFVYSHFLIFSRKFSYIKKEKARFLSKLIWLWLNQSHFKCWVCIKFLIFLNLKKPLSALLGSTAFKCTDM